MVQSCEQYQIHEESQLRQSLQSQFHCLLTDVTCPHLDLHIYSPELSLNVRRLTHPWHPKIPEASVQILWKRPGNDQSLYRTGRVVFRLNVSGFTARMPRCGEPITSDVRDFCIVGRKSPSQWDQFPSKTISICLDLINIGMNEWGQCQRSWKKRDVAKRTRIGNAKSIYIYEMNSIEMILMLIFDKK